MNICGEAIMKNSSKIDFGHVLKLVEIGLMK